MNKLILAIASVAAANQDPCCNVCPDGQIKTYSVDRIFNMCGESCMEPKDYWKYKIFEPGMHKADGNDDTACAKQGYADYKETDTHGVPGLISMVVDMYKIHEGMLDAELSQLTEEDWAAIDEAAEELVQQDIDEFTF